MRNELSHLILFALACFVAFLRADLPDFREKDVYLRGAIAGDIVNEGGYVITKLKVERSEIEELEGRKVFLKVFGGLPSGVERLSLLGSVSVKDNRIFVYASYKDVEILPPEKSVRNFLMERYRETSRDKSMVPLGMSFLFGQPRELLPSDVQRDFLQTGLVHLLVISGLHVGTLALVLSHMLPRFQGLKLALVGVIAYSLIVVPNEPPVLRATIMAVLFILILLSFSKPDTLSILLFSGTVILFLYPHYLFSYSFWLSFVATAYIILMLRGLELSNKAKTLLASASAFTGVSPLIGTFSSISPLSVIYTPLLSPVVLIYSLFGVLSLMTLMSFPPFVDLFNLAGLIFVKVVSLMSELSFSIYPQINTAEAVFLTSSGMVSLYFLEGLYRLLPIFLINSWLFVRALV
ncbi:MAG: ComEC/Rec2 family competence protein [Aquificae bacterium]|nr:ComEC/Rec2 family competence protein [Aquificota bacterium]